MHSRIIVIISLALFTSDIAWTDEGSNVAGSAIIDDGSSGKTVEIKEMEGPVELADAVVLALAHNPELAAFSFDVRAREGDIVQAGLRPNPEISATLENIGGAKEVTGGVQLSIQISQVIELGGKRSARAGLANLSKYLVEKDYERKRVEVLTEVSKAFIKTLSAQRKAAISEEMVGLAEKVLKTVSERVLAGKVSPVEEIKAKLALSSVMIERERSRLELDAARKGLSSLWGSKRPRFEKAVGDLEEGVDNAPTFDQLSARLTNNPDVILRAAGIGQRKASVTLERSKRVQDISVNAGYRRFTDYDENSVIAGVTIPIPLFNRNQGGVLESGLLLLKAEEELRAAEVRAATLLAEAFNTLLTANAEATTLRDAVLPGAQDAYDAMFEGYRMGKFGYLDVLDAQRTLFDVRLQYVRALTNYHISVAEVEQLTGGPVITNKNQR